MHRVTTAE